MSHRQFSDSEEIAAEAGTWISQLRTKSISFNPFIKRVFGSVNAAIMIAQLQHWCLWVLKNDPGREGWVWKTSEEWEFETGMTRTELDNARRKLKKLNILEEKREAVGNSFNRPIWYRLNNQ